MFCSLWLWTFDFFQFFEFDIVRLHLIGAPVPTVMILKNIIIKQQINVLDILHLYERGKRLASSSCRRSHLNFPSSKGKDNRYINVRAWHATIDVRTKRNITPDLCKSVHEFSGVKQVGTITHGTHSIKTNAA